MVALRGTEVIAVPLEAAIAASKHVSPDGDLARAARDLGIALGDEV
jgi:hypothetical protein